MFDSQCRAKNQDAEKANLIPLVIMTFVTLIMSTMACV